MTIDSPPGILVVTFVCTANICRSAYADVMATHRLLSLPGRVHVQSGGTWGMTDSPMYSEMANQAVARGADPTGFRAQRLTRQMVVESDLVLTAEAAHRAFVMEEWPAALSKVFTIGQFTEALQGVEGFGKSAIVHAHQRRLPARSSADIADPYRRGPEAAAACARQVDAALDVILPRLVGGDLL